MTPATRRRILTLNISATLLGYFGSNLDDRRAAFTFIGGAAICVALAIRTYVHVWRGEADRYE